MTEDDTFKRLSRISYFEMQRIWTASPIFWGSSADIDWPDQLNTLFEEHGWTVDEYTEYYKDED